MAGHIQVECPEPLDGSSGLPEPRRRERAQRVEGPPGHLHFILNPSLRSALPTQSNDSPPLSRLVRRWHRRLVTWVYILRCSDDSFYVGHTDDLAGRERTHNDGFGARCTAARRPVSLVYSEQFDSVEQAISRERQLKGWSAGKKQALLDGDLALLRQLSKRRQR